MKRFQFWTGFLSGALLLGGVTTAATAASGIMASISTQPIYVDGQRVPMTAYSIGGNNYVKLRDIGKAVDFGVTYDAATNSVHIDTTAHYEQEVTQPAQTTPTPGTSTLPQLGQGDGYLTNGKPITEENVMELLRQIETEYPAWTVWGGSDTPGTKKNEVPSAVSGALMDSYHVNKTYGCSGYAAMVSSRLFGDKTNPCRKVTDLSQIRPGDIVFRVSNKDGHIWHVEVALESPDDLRSFQITDGNHGGIVWWPDEMSRYSKTVLDCFGPKESYHLEVWTRYPESVPFTGNNAGTWITEYAN